MVFKIRPETMGLSVSQNGPIRGSKFKFGIQLAMLPSSMATYKKIKNLSAI